MAVAAAVVVQRAGGAVDGFQDDPGPFGVWVRLRAGPWAFTSFYYGGPKNSSVEAVSGRILRQPGNSGLNFALGLVTARK